MNESKKIFFLLILGIVGTGILIAYEHLQPPRRQALILATTTSTFDSGLLDHLIPIFEGKYDIKVKILSKGTGESIEIAKRGDADVILVHARQLEEAFVSEGYGVHRVGVMYNDFIIIGPKSDPAGIRGLTDASLAFKKIFEAGSRGDATFISRADNSGTHNKELSIWTKIDVKPSSKTFSWYLEAGAGMGAVLRMTDEKGAYALTDRGTWLASKNRLGNLAVMVEGDTILLNPYAVIPINPERYPQRNYKMALAFVKFLISEEGQELIGNFERGGETLFFPIARDYNKAHELGFPNQEREVRWYDSIDPFALILTFSSRLRSGPAS